LDISQLEISNSQGDAHLELRKEVRASDVNLTIVSIWMKIIRLPIKKA
jgi:hypothetical protein